jgi:hypothetical protein
VQGGRRRGAGLTLSPTNYTRRVSWREQRIGENESRFRLVNERLRDRAVDAADAVGQHPDSFDILCECADIDCNEKLHVSITTYEWVRSAPARFLIAPGHEVPGSERVVRDVGGIYVVEKFGDARAAASELDPRTN